MGLQARVVFVLLVDEEPARSVCGGEPRTSSSRALARFFQLTSEESGHFAFVSDLRHPRYGQDNHCCSPALDFCFDLPPGSLQLGGEFINKDGVIPVRTG